MISKEFFFAYHSVLETPALIFRISFAFFARETQNTGCIYLYFSKQNTERQCCGSVTFCYESGCGCGSSDLHLCLTDPDLDAEREFQKCTDPTDPDPEHW